MHARVWTRSSASERVPIVMVHGLGVSGRYMIPTATYLAKTHAVYVPDLPGFGESEKPRSALDVVELAEALSDWMDAVGLRRAALVANSLGCQVVVHLARMHPERVAAAVLQAPTTDRCARKLSTQFIRLLIDAFLEPPSLTPLVIQDYLKCGLVRAFQTFRYGVDDTIEEHVPHVDVPAIIVRGSRDPIVPQPWAEEVARLLPGGRLIVIQGAAHAINYAQPGEFARVIRDFLSAHEETPIT